MLFTNNEWKENDLFFQANDLKQKKSFQVDQLSRVLTVWDNFQAQMDSHEAVISKQVQLFYFQHFLQLKNEVIF